MGLLKFDLPDDLPEELRSALARCWIAGGYDGCPVPSRRKLESQKLTITRDEVESGYLQLAWPIGTPSYVIGSSTLRQRPEPYSLLTELARGTVNRLRSLLAELDSVPIAVDPALRSLVQAQTYAFGRMISGGISISTAATQQIIESCRQGIDQAVALFGQYRLKIRQHANGSLPLWFGSRITKPLSSAETEVYLESFNAIRIVPNWSALEAKETVYNWSTLDPLVHWAASTGMGVSIGPMIDLAGPFPEWLQAWEGDLPSLSACMTEYMSVVFQRYRQHVRVWQVFSGMNHADAMGLMEDDRVRLAARLLEATKELDSEAVWIMGISQPWGDYLSSDQQTYSPLVFADTLLRAGYPVGGIELEMLFTEHARKSNPRDALDVIQLVELFDHLSLPLEISFQNHLATGGELPTAFTALASSPSIQALYWGNGNDADSKQWKPFEAFRKNWLR